MIIPQVSISLIMDATLSLLLAATLIYCAMLERRLRILRKDQTGLDRTLRGLGAAINAAQASLKQLRSAGEEASENLGKKVTTGRALADELALLTSAGERIAKRIEMGRLEHTPKGDVPRIPVLRGTNPEALRAVR